MSILSFRENVRPVGFFGCTYRPWKLGCYETGISCIPVIGAIHQVNRCAKEGARIQVLRAKLENQESNTDLVNSDLAEEDLDSDTELKTQQNRNRAAIVVTHVAVYIIVAIVSTAILTYR